MKAQIYEKTNKYQICPVLLTTIAVSSEQDAFFYASPQAAAVTDLRQHESPENSLQ